MNPTLIKIAQFFARRPKDTTIRTLHIVTGLLILFILWWSQDRSVIDIPFYGETSPLTEKKIEYGLMIFALFFLVRGLLTTCILKQKGLRIIQAIHGFILVMIGGPMMDPIVKSIITTPTTSTGGFQIDTTVASLVEMSWHPGVFLVLLGILWIFIGLTGKGTTEKCIRYGEVVKKIRV